MEKHYKENFILGTYKKQGFSLVEVLLAIVILAAIAGPIANAFFTSMKTNLRSREMMGATDFTSSIVEEIESHTMDEIQSSLERNTIGEDDSPYRLYSIGISKEDCVSHRFEELMGLDDFYDRCRDLKQKNTDNELYYGYFLDEDKNVHYCYFLSNVAFSKIEEKNARYNFDVTIEFVPASTADTMDEYYTYEFTVNTYKNNNKDRFKDHQCSLMGSIFNKY